MLKKIYTRFKDNKGRHSSAENYRWLQENEMPFTEFAQSVDPDLWRKSEIVARDIDEAAKRKLCDIPHDLGGGGLYPLLYFITRHKKPSVVVETGVAAGYSSAGILNALSENQHGKLYSSDFPYFRIPSPERYIGIVVDESLVERWSLYIEGDERNLPTIVNEVGAIDLFHYDSDKSYSGREYALGLIGRALSPNAVVLIDDIQDNSFFMDYVERYKPDFWRVFAFEGKYVGMVGNID